MNFVLLPGFGLGAFPLQRLHSGLQAKGHSVTLVDLPQDPSWESYLSTLPTPQTPSVVVGWSLGGQVATLLAQKWDCALVTLASNPRFCTTDDWPCAMPVEEFRAFEQRYITQPDKSRLRFAALVCQGDAQAKAYLGQLRNSFEHSVDVVASTQQLRLLAELDTRSVLASLSVPQYHFFAGQDALVPAGVAQRLALPAASSQVFQWADASHFLPYTHAPQLVEALCELFPGE
ncbi:alpha/beta fold hydrolase [Paenalcaligenes sp. Me131]|uniref:alpha/beta fold hydrolase n=1 Tax=Paenalcaligenes sp. Me131 TaxID=3392636 RepID=UPI003D2ABDC8